MCLSLLKNTEKFLKGRMVLAGEKKQVFFIKTHTKEANGTRKKSENSHLMFLISPILNYHL